jgi:MarR family transcriptional regulator, lower aerobic nicotinate degradation pathway regulator
MQTPTKKRAKKRGKPPPPDATLAAMVSLRRIVRALRVFSHTTERNLRISGAQLFVLQALKEEPGISLKALAERTLTDQSSVSVVASRLVEQGMIKRRIAAEDARRSRLELTARGRELLREAPEALQTRLIRGLRSLPPGELTSVARALEKLVVHLEVEGDAAGMFFEGEPARARVEKRRRRVGA